MKKQDILVLAKLLSLDRRSEPWSYAVLSERLGLSKSEAHAAVARLEAAGLVRPDDHKPRRSPAFEFLVHGAKYCFPAKLGSLTRGMPTSYAASPLNRHFPAGDEPVPVWPDQGGSVRGVELAPLYHTVPQAAAEDADLYEILSLFDAIRAGRARERQAAEKELEERVLV